MVYKINQTKCLGCQMCLQICPGAIEINNEGKAQVIDQDKLEQCGGEDICPHKAIESVNKGDN